MAKYGKRERMLGLTRIDTGKVVHLVS